MALTQKQREYHREYRRKNVDKYRASFKRWYEKHGEQNREERREVIRASARKLWRKTAGGFDTVSSEQELAEAQLRYPYKKLGPKEKFIGEEKVTQRRAVVRKARYRNVKGIPTFHEPDHCEICGEGGKICLDHDHTSNEFRGWICNNCNLAISYAKENQSLLSKMAEYIERSRLIKSA